MQKIRRTLIATASDRPDESKKPHRVPADEHEPHLGRGLRPPELEEYYVRRAEGGPFFPILVRFSADEFLKDGLDMEQAVEIAKLLEANGVDAIDISAGGLRWNAEDAFQDAAYPVIRVGDAIRAGKIHAAIYTAYCAAREL